MTNIYLKKKWLPCFIFILLISITLSLKAENNSAQGSGIEPTHNLALLQKFITLYNPQIAAKSNYPEGAILNVKSDTELMGGNFLASSSASYELYKIDINNDGQDEYMLVDKCSGSACTTMIDSVYHINNNQLAPIDFQSLVDPNGGNWYVHVATPFITLQNGKYLLNYQNDEPSAICTYLWQDGKVKLVHGLSSVCVST